MNIKSDNWKILAAGAAAATLAPFGAAEAATLTYTDSIARQRTNFTEAFDITRFDSSLGTLNSVTIELSGTVDGIIGLENLDAEAADVSGTLRARITLDSPTGSPLLVVLPDATESVSFPEADGSIDFNGDSGDTINVMNTQPDTDSVTLTTGLNPFIGTGSISLNARATGESQANGAGNFASFFNTFASANLRVIYDYTEASTDVPEPGLSLAAFAILGAGAVKLRKRAKHS